MLANLLLMAQVVVPLVVCEPTHMLLVEGSLDGTPCTLVFDTGATHTSFDEEFIAKALPEAHPEPVMLAGTSNANFVPKIAMSKTLKVGEVAFEGYPVMAIPFPPLSQKLGRPVHGILGMDIIGQMPLVLSVAQGEIIFNPDDMTGFGPPLKFDRRDYDGSPKLMYLAADGTYKTMLVDSGSSLSFINDPADWPAEEVEAATMGATDVNGRAAMAMRPGKPGTLQLKTVKGGDYAIRFRPLVNPGAPCSYLGADTLRHFDLFLRLPWIGLRPVESGRAESGKTTNKE